MVRIRGFTLIELMIVIAIIGVMFAVGSIKFNEYIDDDRAEKAAYKLKYDIAYLQNRKMADTRNYKILFDNNTKSYACFIDENDNNTVDTGEILYDPATKLPINFEFYISGSREASIRNFDKVELIDVKIYNQAGADAAVSGRTAVFIDKYGAAQVKNGSEWEDISSNVKSEITLKCGNYTKKLTLYPLTTEMKIE